MNRNKTIEFSKGSEGLIEAFLRRELEEFKSLSSAIVTHIKNIKNLTMEKKRLHPDLMKNLTEYKASILDIERKLKDYAIFARDGSNGK